jgi:PhnB protein
MAIKGARGETYHIGPHLMVNDARAAVEFYKRALGAVELYSSPLPEGAGMHFQVRIGKAIVKITDEAPRGRGGSAPENERIEETVALRSPQSLGGTTVVLEMLVDDVDAAYKKAVDAGATPVLPVSDWFWGDRYGILRDRFGHVWALATVLDELTPEQVEKKIEEMMARMGEGGEGH